MILGPNGKLIWFHPASISQRLLSTDFRVQTLHGQRVLTWWQGYQNAGSGRGVGMIYNRHYQRVAVVHAGNGLEMDLHEFLVTPDGTAWLIAASPVSLPGMNRPVIDSVVQQVDIKTGLVMFEWHALDHVGLEESYKYGADVPGHVVDPYHMNSISIAHDGNLVLSMRNTSAVYDVDHRSGQIIWRLGGKDSSFALGAGHRHRLPAQRDRPRRRLADDLRQRRRAAQGPSVLARDPRGARPGPGDGDPRPRLQPHAGGLGELRGRRPDAAGRRRVPRLRTAAVVHPVRPLRPARLRRPVRRAELELPRLPLPMERRPARQPGDEARLDAVGRGSRT